jgi:hypothetical protein
MFGLTLPKTGAERIADAVAQFEAIAAKIDTGVAECRSTVDANNAAIVTLAGENVALTNVADRGQVVAARLRDLVS